MKPRLFIGSSTESHDLALATQAELARRVEATVWSQIDWELSHPTLKTLLTSVRSSDFGLFIFAPDDVSKIRGKEFSTVRDNVIFELGLFIGRLGAERSFMVVPEGHEDLHLPTDLLGLTAATYDPNREDGYLRAALGPACFQIANAIARMGRFSQPSSLEAANPAAKPDGSDDEGDIKAALQSWMGSRHLLLNTQAIRFSEIDRELKLPAGSTAMYLEEIAKRWNFHVVHRGKNSILFEQISTDVPYF